MSNSGRLKQRIFELAENISYELDVQVENPVDAIIKTKPLVSSGDAIILDECAEWFNLVPRVIEETIGEYGFVDILPEM